MTFDPDQSAKLAGFILGAYPRIFFKRMLKKVSGDGGIYALTKEELAQVFYETQVLTSAAISGVVISGNVKNVANVVLKDEEKFEAVYDYEHMTRVYANNEPFAKEEAAFDAECRGASGLDVERLLGKLIERANIDPQDHDCDNCAASGSCPIEDAVRRKLKNPKK